MTTAIVGGGFAGLASAYYMDEKSIVFEADSIGGGLASYFKFKEGDYLEKYYHHFFLTDKPLVNLSKEIGIKITSAPTRMGFSVNRKIYPFGSPVDLLRFSPLNIFDRFKLGFMILYFMLKKDYTGLEKITAEKWLMKYMGRDIYEKVWKPLLIIKFGNSYNEVSASWLWGRIHPRGRSRSAEGEVLNYFNGGFRTLHQALKNRITEKGSEIVNEKVAKITKKGETYQVNGGIFDRIILTVPNPIIRKIMPDINLPDIKYKSIVCLCMKLDRKLSDFYWINATDDVKFGGIIEHTNFVDKERYNGNIVYLFNYIDSESHFYKLSEKDIYKVYTADLKKLFPKFDTSWVKEYKVFKDRFATPVYVKGYNKLKPGFITNLDNVYIANTSMIYPEDRNVSNSVALGKKVASLVRE